MFFFCIVLYSSFSCVFCFVYHVRSLCNVSLDYFLVMAKKKKKQPWKNGDFHFREGAGVITVWSELQGSV